MPAAIRKAGSLDAKHQAEAGSRNFFTRKISVTGRRRGEPAEQDLKRALRKLNNKLNH